MRSGASTSSWSAAEDSQLRSLLSPPFLCLTAVLAAGCSGDADAQQQRMQAEMERDESGRGIGCRINSVTHAAVTASVAPIVASFALASASVTRRLSKGRGCSAASATSAAYVACCSPARQLLTVPLWELLSSYFTRSQLAPDSGGGGCLAVDFELCLSLPVRILIFRALSPVAVAVADRGVARHRPDAPAAGRGLRGSRCSNRLLRRRQRSPADEQRADAA